MNETSTRLARRREHLIARASTQRAVLAQVIEPWRTPLSLADRGLDMLRVARRHPVWMVGGVALLAVLLPGPAGKWLRRGWAAWQVMHKLARRVAGA